MRVAVLLPMKAHSERVPNKNMRNFCGKPLYHAIVNTLLGLEVIDKIVINTDSVTIKKDAMSNFNNVQLINRPAEICGDYVSMNDIISYDIDQVHADYYLQTHSTNPLLKGDTIKRAIDYLLANADRHDSLFSVTRYQSRFFWKNGSPLNHDPGELIRTQDLEPIYEENSCLYIFSRESFRAAGNKRIGLKPLMFEIDKMEAIDIDEEEDFLLAERLYD